YDLCDHNQINPELGGEAAYRELVARLEEHGMGHILDMVPNHMAASTQNPWWYDVLENGPNSPYAHFFDIDWHPIKPELEDQLPPQTARDLASVRERQREKEVVKRRLRDLTAFSEPVRRHIERNIARYNGQENDPASIDSMDKLLDEQAYRLCHWRAAFDEIN